MWELIEMLVCEDMTFCTDLARRHVVPFFCIATATIQL